MDKDDLANWNRFLNSPPEQREEMSDDEALRAAVNIVANKLHEDGNKILQASFDITSTPNIWFKRGDVVSYVIVTFARYPKNAEPPNQASLIHQQLITEGFSGYWIGVNLANEFEAFDPKSNEGLALMKGFGLLPLIGPLIPMSDLT